MRVVFPASCSPRLRVLRLSPEIAWPTFRRGGCRDRPRPTPSRSGAGRITGSHSPYLSAGALGGVFIYFRYGREPRPNYDREYEQEPPSDLPPAEVGALFSQGQVDEKQFTATLFDLIRKDVIKAEPVKVNISSWAGLRSETVDDLQLSITPSDALLTEPEQKVLNVVSRVLDGEARPLNEFRSGIREDAAANAATISRSARSRCARSRSGSSSTNRKESFRDRTRGR